MEPLDSREDRAILHSRPVPAQVNIDLLLEWINICKEHHTLQLKGTVEEHAMRPNVSLFAVDGSKMCITQLPDLGQYAALSYVWGPSGRQLKWTADRLRTAGGLNRHWQDVPTTISDAITLCQSLRIPYLWVDALCIPQDDEKLKAQFISEMDRIYGNSFLTIVAPMGKDSSPVSVPTLAKCSSLKRR